MKDWYKAIALVVEVVEGAVESEEFRNTLSSEIKEVARRYVVKGISLLTSRFET